MRVVYVSCVVALLLPLGSTDDATTMDMSETQDESCVSSDMFSSLEEMIQKFGSSFKVIPRTRFSKRDTTSEEMMSDDLAENLTSIIHMLPMGIMKFTFERLSDELSDCVLCNEDEQEAFEENIEECMIYQTNATDSNDRESFIENVKSWMTCLEPVNLKFSAICNMKTNGIPSFLVN